MVHMCVCRDFNVVGPNRELKEDASAVKDEFGLLVEQNALLPVVGIYPQLVFGLSLIHI